MPIDYTQRPAAEHQSEYHKTLVAKVPDGDIIQLNQQQVETFPDFVCSIAPDQAEVVHSPYTWSVRQVIEHCLDAERVFGYRSLRFANGDMTPLPGWDENIYAATGYGANADLPTLASEFVALRQANVALLKRLSAAAWDTAGVADDRPFSVRTIAWLMAGHLIHHVDILRERLA